MTAGIVTRPTWWLWCQRIDGTDTELPLDAIDDLAAAIRKLACAPRPRPAAYELRLGEDVVLAWSSGDTIAALDGAAATIRGRA